MVSKSRIWWAWKGHCVGWHGLLVNNGSFGDSRRCPDWYTVGELEGFVPDFRSWNAETAVVVTMTCCCFEMTVCVYGIVVNVHSAHHSVLIQLPAWTRFSPKFVQIICVTIISVHALRLISRTWRVMAYITHTRLTALFRGHPGEPVPER